MHQIYHLTGIRETAGGITLYADNTFDFYLSYGAIDRHGYGNWKQEQDIIFLDSNYSDKQGFTIVEQGNIDMQGFQISLKNPDPYFAGMMHGFAITGSTSEEQHANEKGVMQFTTQAPEKLLVMNELFPDQIITIMPESNSNHLILEPNHDVFLLHFAHLQCVTEENKIYIPLPLLSMYFGDRKFTFEKQTL